VVGLVAAHFTRRIHVPARYDGTMADQSTCRWYQFGLWELLVLVTILVIVWWQDVTQPTTQYFGLGSGKMTVIVMAPSAIAASMRGLIWSAATICAWAIAIFVIRRLRQITR
jgi:hypothetical protein